MKSSKVMNFRSLEFPQALWRSLITDLRKRGHGYRESGAFLLGRSGLDKRVVQAWLPYDELDAKSLNYDYVRVGSEAFARLWEECARRGLEVVADVHTHPMGPAQSYSDRNHPMVAVAGHMALIVPRFAQGVVMPRDISVNIYLGGKRWASHYGSRAEALIRLS
jgi:proteasome lid subunit RPN8/RPN11